MKTQQQSLRHSSLAKIFLIVLLVVCMSACEKKASESASAAPEPVTLPLEVSYKGTPVIGSMKNAKIVMEWNKAFSELNPEIGVFLADTVTWHMADGTELTATRDSAMVQIKKFMGSLSNMKIEYVAIMPADNPDQKHEWVFSWTDETYTYKDGKVEQQSIHEDYRIEGGKIREIFQYARKTPAEGAK